MCVVNFARYSRFNGSYQRRKIFAININTILDYKSFLLWISINHSLKCIAQVESAFCSISRHGSGPRRTANGDLKGESLHLEDANSEGDLFWGVMLVHMCMAILQVI